MKRLALLAATVLGTGCIVTSDDDPTCSVRDLDVVWANSFDGPGASIGQSCAAAGVVDVDVYLNDTFVATFPCSGGGATVTDLASGNYLLTVEGIDAGGAIRYRAEQDVTATSCGVRTASVRPGAGTVNLVYTLPGDTCFSAFSYMWFGISDAIASGAIAAVVDNLSPLDVKRSFPCGPDVVLSLPVGTLPAGNYRLDFMQEVEEVSTNNFVQRARACAQPTFNVAARALTDVPVPLVDTGVACP